MSTKNGHGIDKLETGITGFDFIAYGGLPRGRTTLVSGTAGSAKTVFATQFLAEGIRQSGEAGVFITFEESPDDIRDNMAGFGWPIEEWEKEGRWAFVDASPLPGEYMIESGSYDLGALLARIEHAVNRVSARRLSMDSLGAILMRFGAKSMVRTELVRIILAIKSLGVTAVLTSECEDDHSMVGRFGVEEFVADNVVILRNILEAEKRRRTIEILKFRGTLHQKGEFPFTVLPEQGIVIIPLSAMELKQRSSDVRITSGNAELDAMCGGGFFRDSVVLVSGATGTGKTLMTSEFIAGGLANGERCLLFAFEESREQLFRNAGGWGMDFQHKEGEGRLMVVCEYPEVFGLEDHLIRMKAVIEEFKPNRVAVDSLSALERVSVTKSFREFVISLSSFIKHQEIAGLFTATTASLMGGTSVTETHISTITDSIILLRYVEMLGEMKRALTVLKMRGSLHDKEIREFSIDHQGMHIGRPFRNTSGIMAGHPQHFSPDEIDRLNRMFTDGRDL